MIGSQIGGGNAKAVSSQSKFNMGDVNAETHDYVSLPGVDSDVGKLKFTRFVDSGVQKWTVEYEHLASDKYTVISESKSRAAAASEGVATSDRFTVMTMVGIGSETKISDDMKKSSAHNLSTLELYLQNQSNPAQHYLYKIFCVNQDEGFNDDMIVTVYSL